MCAECVNNCVCAMQAQQINKYQQMIKLVSKAIQVNLNRAAAQMNHTAQIDCVIEYTQYTYTESSIYIFI